MTDGRPTHLDLFSGIGGFALAANQAGFRTIGFCEIDPYCRKVLAKNFGVHPDANLGNGSAQPWQQQESVASKSDSIRPRIFPNIFDLDGHDFANVSLITGGFPCQPFSFAGKRRGAADDRALWPEMFRVIAQARPAWVLGENVPGIIPMELDNVLSDLEGIGYATRSFVIPACAVDARHRRDRVWIIGRNVAESESEQGSSRNNGGEQGQALGSGEVESGRSYSGSMRQRNGQSQPKFCRMVNGLFPKLDGGLNEQVDSTKKITAKYFTEWENLRTVWRWCESTKAPPELRLRKMFDSLSFMSCGYGLVRWNATKETDEEVLGLWQRLSSSSFQEAQHLFSELLERIRTNQRQQEMASWEAEPNVGRVTTSVKNRVDRLKGLGNAIVPQVAFQLLYHIRQLLP